ncbi:hypothetical protein M9978_16325 [Sphingomonas sp. MG17]|uniref:Uncharacterized protein n=1 Tax=Sphingomonas tagetis TaxID=2949092 RepID=A0A9X2HLT2_9SPHN|nr:hypothetical protein [Sphingomonas tagetis]MCP3731992.1 hypothetical protein [Sphingomonas tagetis]
MARPRIPRALAAAVIRAAAASRSADGTPTPSPTPAPSWSVQPSISGTPQVGETLTGGDGTISNGTVSARAWLRNSSAISGANGTTYLLVGDDEGADISFKVTASGDGGTTDATSAEVGPVEAAPEPSEPALFGVNVNPSFQRTYNNLLAKRPWIDPVGDYDYTAYPHVNAAGALVSVPAGLSYVSRDVLNPGAGTTGWFRIVMTGGGDGSTVYVSADPATTEGAVVQIDSHTWEFQFDVPGGTTGPNSGVEVRCTATPSTPITNIDCREITGAEGAYVSADTWHPGFVARLQANADYFRTLDLQGINSPHMPTRLYDDWADRALSRDALGYRSAKLVHGTGSSKLKLVVKAYVETDEQAELLAERMATDTMWTGLGGNELTLTILAASGAGSVALNGDLDIVVTPAAGATSAAQIAAQLYAHAEIPLMVNIFAGTNTAPVGSDEYNAGLAAGAVATLAETNFSGGFDGAMGGYWPDLIQLANDVGQAGPWLHMPFNANENYATGLGAMLDADLDEELRDYTIVEIHNEAWNFATQATRWLLAVALFEGQTGSTEQEIILKGVADRAVQNFAALLVEAPWVRTSVGSQTGSPQVTQWLLDYPGFDSSVVKMIAFAPYFYPTPPLPSDDDEYFAQLYASAALIPGLVEDQLELLDPVDIEADFYEWGQHDNFEDDMTEAERRRDDPRMGDVHNFAASELARRCGVGVTRRLTFFNDYSPTGLGTSGQWGLYRYVGEAPTPKSIAWAAIRTGQYLPYKLPAAALSVSGTRVEGSDLTYVIPAVYRTDTITVQPTRDGVDFGSPFVLEPGDPNPTYTQVSGDIGTIISGSMLLENAHASVEYTFADGAATEADIPPFSLDDLTDLMARWDANVSLSNSLGQNVWLAAQGSGTLQSVGNPATIGTADGHPALIFAKSTYDNVPSNVDVGTGDFTFLIVGKLAGSGIDGDNTLFGCVNNNGPSVDMQGSGTTLRLVRQMIAVQGSVTAGIDLTDRFVITARYRTSDKHWSLRVNNVEVGNGTGGADFSAGVIHLGFNVGNGAGFNGPIHCFAVCNSYLSEGLVAAWEAFEADAWDITLT